MLLVTVDLPWPFSSRECVLDACGVDDIDANGDGVLSFAEFCVMLNSLSPSIGTVRDSRTASMSD